jgi:hypothetical protein
VLSRLAAGVTLALSGSSAAALLPLLTPSNGPIFLTYPLHLSLHYVHLIYYLTHDKLDKLNKTKENREQNLVSMLPLGSGVRGSARKCREDRQRG